MLPYILFYSILTLTSFGFYKFWTRNKAKNSTLGQKILRGSYHTILIFSFLLLWTFQIAYLVAPRGSLVYELIRLPVLIYNLIQIEPQSVEIEKVSYGTDPKQYLLVCKPKDQPINKDKVIVYIHGGGWHTGSPERNYHMADVFGQEGYLVILMAYRLGPQNGFYELRSDIDQGFLKAKDIVDNMGLDSTKWVVGGTSAGGNLAALLVYDRERLNKLGLQQKQVFGGFFSLVGALNLDVMPKTIALKNYAGETESEQFKAANPIQHLEASETLPVLLIHGTNDGLVNYQSSTSFVQALKDRGNTSVEFHTVNNATHLEVGAQWYYDPSTYHNQRELMLNWLNKL
ncbi:MAG: alpha/beta hydrolase [Saprospiraceae bacterium]|nr:alpha/beta hydrolase [Saprospiraceae bacterium]